MIYHFITFFISNIGKKEKRLLGKRENRPQCRTQSRKILPKSRIATRWKIECERCEDGYIKGFFVATDAFGDPYFYLLYICAGKSKE